MSGHPAAIPRLIAAGTFIGVGAALSGVHLVTGWGPPCPWRMLTGTLCPFCGSTQLGGALLRADLASAWAANPFVFVLLAGLGVASFTWIVEAAGGPRVRLPGRLRDQRFWYAVIGVAALIFMVARNISSCGGGK